MLFEPPMTQPAVPAAAEARLAEIARHADGYRMQVLTVPSVDDEGAAQHGVWELFADGMAHARHAGEC